MFRKSFDMRAAALGFGQGNLKPAMPAPTDFKPKQTRGKGGRKFTTKASGVAASKRAAKKRSNIRKRKGK